MQREDVGCRATDKMGRTGGKGSEWRGTGPGREGIQKPLETSHLRTGAGRIGRSNPKGADNEKLSTCWRNLGFMEKLSTQDVTHKHAVLLSNLQKAAKSYARSGQLFCFCRWRNFSPVWGGCVEMRRGVFGGDSLGGFPANRRWFPLPSRSARMGCQADSVAGELGLHCIYYTRRVRGGGAVAAALLGSNRGNRRAGWFPVDHSAALPCSAFGVSSEMW